MERNFSLNLQINGVSPNLKSKITIGQAVKLERIKRQENPPKIEIRI
jgi:hypothetical protein